MAQTCDHCGEIFYSETEYREHRLVEEMLSALKRSQEGVSGTGQLLSWIAAELQLHNVLTILRSEKLSGVTEASQAYRSYMADLRKTITQDEVQQDAK